MDNNFFKTLLCDFFADNSDISGYVYSVTFDPVNGLKTYHNTLPKQSEREIELKKQIYDKRKQINTFIADLNFESAIPLRDELKTLQTELEQEREFRKTEEQKNQDTKQTLRILQKNLDLAIDKEDYEGAAKLRDEIKILGEKFQEK